MFLYIYEKDIKLSDIKNLKAYLFKAFRRKLLLKKKAASQTYLPLSTSTDIQFFTNDFLHKNAQQKRKNEHLSQLLNELPWRQREAIYLKYFNDLSTKEIAEIMGIQPQVVSNTIYKALKKMKSKASVLPF